MATSSIAVVVILFLVVGQLGTVQSSGSTIIKSPSGWSSVEGSNLTLGCWVSLTNNDMNADTVCRTRIRFTRNSTSIAEGPRHIRSDSTRDVQTNRITCTMTMFRLRSEDSGLYGCCWPDVEGMCSRHPTRMLRVMPALTEAPTTTPESPTTSSAMSTGSRAPSENNEVVYQTISMRSGPTASGGENEAYNQKSGSSIHKTIWPLLLVIAVLVILIILGKRYMKRKSSDGHSVTARDPESPENLSQVLDHSLAYDMDGVVATTITTTTTTVLNRIQDEDSQR